MTGKAWVDVPLAAVGQIVTGTTPSSGDVDAWGSDVPFLTPTDIVGSTRFVRTGRHLSQRGVSRLRTRLLPNSSVCFTCIGATIGKMCMTSGLTVTNQQINSIVVDKERFDPVFVYFNLRHHSRRIAGMASGSATPIINKEAFGRQRLSFPGLGTQRAIAEVLGALDDKIECNTLIAGLLERRLAELFTALSFDELKGDLVRLDELVELNPVRAKPRATVAPYIDMAALPTESALVAVPNTRPPKSGARFINGDTVMARITPCLENGKTAYIDCLVKGEAGIGSTEFIVLRPRNDLPAKFAYFLARSPRFRDFAVRHMSGSSGRQRCPADALARYEICRPTSDALAKFAEQADPAFARMRTGLDESLVLAQLRDALLPRLLSGEMRVRDAEAAVEEVA